MSAQATKASMPVVILKDGAVQSKGRVAQKNNIAAAKIIAEIVQTSLGPRGMDKMIVDSLGDVTITNDGATILKEIDVKHPDAEMLVEFAKPTDNEFNAMDVGWKLVRQVKSNAIVLADNMQLLGVGAGQMSRIDSVKIAIQKVTDNGLNLHGSILASDAFFPFSDSVELAAEAGITAIIQPGGSIKDDEIISKANELGIAMVFTNTRHFLH